MQTSGEASQVQSISICYMLVCPVTFCKNMVVPLTANCKALQQQALQPYDDIIYFLFFFKKHQFFQISSLK